MHHRIALIGLLAACTDTVEATQAIDTRWVPAWADEFDGEAGSAPDPSSWTPDVGGDGWGNEQLEYNSDSTDNAFIDGDGHLVIRALRQSTQGMDYSSARLTTRGAVEPGPGRVEARIRVPEGQGIWPAFWLLGTDFDTAGWPACGEIDILEVRGEDPGEVLTTVHGPGYSGAASVGQTTQLPFDNSAADDFHTYAVDIDPELITWWIDGERVHTVAIGDLPAGSPWAFDGSFFIILNGCRSDSDRWRGRSQRADRARAVTSVAA